jgi:outer membrane protein OmpA-like peptidoglycan-associated protein
MTIRAEIRLGCLGLAFAVGLPGVGATASLDTLKSTWPELNLQAKLNATLSPQVEQGSNLEVSITADDEATVAIVLVSADGKARVLTLNRGEADNRVTRGTPLIFPDLNAGETLYANLPVGKANAYVVASREPIFQQEEFASWTSIDAVASKVEGAGAAVDVERLGFYVTSSQPKEFVTEEEFVRFFGEATRDVVNPSQGFIIEFETGAADITSWGKKQLDVVGRGMNNGDLAGKAFRLEGHTDDVGTAEFNMDLSRRRAQSVREYLLSKGVSASRVATRAMGESSPFVPGETEAARKKNRRVEIRRVDQ